MKKFILCASVSFIFISLNTQTIAMLDSSEEGSAEKKTTSSRRKSPNDTFFKKLSEEEERELLKKKEKERKKLIKDLAALLTSFRSTLNGFKDLIGFEDLVDDNTATERKTPPPLEQRIRDRT